VSTGFCQYARYSGFLEHSSSVVFIHVSSQGSGLTRIALGEGRAMDYGS
jgi:hypothetical protein